MRAPLGQLIRRAKGSSPNVRYKQPVGHTFLEVLEHAGLSSRYADRQRLACGRSELDDICAVSLRAKDHDPVLAGGGHRSRSLSRSRSNRRCLSNARRLASNASSVVSATSVERPCSIVRYARVAWRYTPCIRRCVGRSRLSACVQVLSPPLFPNPPLLPALRRRIRVFH